MKKIMFQDKITSLNIKSKYIISSFDINEIKDTVNSISTLLSDQIELNKSRYNYIIIQLPKNIDQSYDIEIEVTEDNWENDIRTIKLSENSSLFFIFKNNIFKNLSNSFLSNENSNQKLLVKIFDLINNLGNISCRIRFKNLSNNLYTDYFSVDLNINAKVNEKNLNFIGYKFYTVANLKYKNHIAELLNIGFDLDFILSSINYTFEEKNEITLFSFIYNGINIIDVTSLTSYSSNDNSIIFNENKIEPLKTQIFKRFIVNSSIIYNGQQFFNICNININPIYLTDIEATFSSINYKNEEYYVSFFAKYSNKTKLNINQDSNFSLSIKNGYFSYNYENGILIPLNENTIDEITISYFDHDFSSERIEKTYVLKIEGLKLYNLVATLEKNYLTTINNKTKYTVKAYYNDGTIKDVTYDENLDVIFYNNKIKENNTVFLDKENAEISTNPVYFDDLKYVSFSILDEKTNKKFFTLNQIFLINELVFSISGEIITSNGEFINSINFETDLNGFEETKKLTINEDMTDVKKLQNLTFDNLNSTNSISNIAFDPFEKYAPFGYFKVDLYLTDEPTCVNFLVNSKYLSSLNKSIIFDFPNINTKYKLIFSTVSKTPGAKFIKNLILPLNKTFDENYIIAFKNVEFNLIEKNSILITFLELIKIEGIFESSNGYEFTKEFIYDEQHNFWLIKDVPLKAIILKSLKVSIAYLEDVKI